MDSSSGNFLSGNHGSLLSHYMQSVQQSLKFKTSKTSLSETAADQHLGRVERLDGEALQSHFLYILRSHFNDAIEGFRQNHMLRCAFGDLFLENNIVFHIVMVFLTATQHYGDRLVNLKYNISPKKMRIFLLFTVSKVLAPYLIGKLYTFAFENDWKNKRKVLWQSIKILEICTKLVSILGLMVVQCTSHSRSILDILFNFHIENEHRQIVRIRSPSVLLRALLFGEVLSLYTFYAPIVKSMRKILTEKLLQIWQVLRRFIFAASKPTQEETERENVVGKDIRYCAFCQDDPIQTPVDLYPCHHRVCYFCIMQHIATTVFQADELKNTDILWQDFIIAQYHHVDFAKKLQVQCPICDQCVTSMSRC